MVAFLSYSMKKEGIEKEGRSEEGEEVFFFFLVGGCGVGRREGLGIQFAKIRA